MKDTARCVERLAHVIPDIACAMCAMDSVGQSLVDEVGSLRNTLTKRDNRVKVCITSWGVDVPVP